MISSFRVLLVAMIFWPLIAFSSDQADVGKVRLAPKEIEAAFARLQQLRLPMPVEDAWQKLGLPTEEKLQPLIFGGGPISVFRWRLSDRLADGSFYTLSVICSRPKEKTERAILLKAFFAIEHDEEDRPALVLVDRGFAFAELMRSKEGPIQPPQRNAGSRPSSDDSSASETPSALGPRG